MKKYGLIFVISLIYLMICFPKVVCAGIFWNETVAPAKPNPGPWDLYVEETYIKDKDGADIKTYSVMLVGNQNNTMLGDKITLHPDNDTSLIQTKYNGSDISDLRMYFSGEPDKCIATKYSIRWGKERETSILANLFSWGGEPIYVIPFDYEVYNNSNEVQDAQKVAQDIASKTGYTIRVVYETVDGQSGDFTFKFTGVQGQAKRLGDKGFLQIILDYFNDPLGTVADGIETILNGLLLPLGDGVLTLINTSVGEIVTIDRLIFNKVSKVSIDYFNENTDVANAGGQRPVKAMMRIVVNSWYSFFRTIAILVYMMLLVVVGIRVMLSSTANKKAQYQEMLVNWVVGVVLLFFFPYVMKYTIELNDGILSELHTYLYPETVGETYPTSGDYSMFDKNKTTLSLAGTWGKDEFVELMLGKSIKAEDVDDLVNTNVIKEDGMMYVRVYAQKLNKLFLTGVYFIQIGQTIVLLFMYYKRAFMLAFLITIFPLVAMTYVLDKVGDKKAQSFGIWFKEFLVNVIVQIFHAVVYVIITSTGVQTFIDTGGSNWIFMIISVLFLFEGEKILRNIFGVKSAAGTIGDLAATGAMVWGATKRFGNVFGKPGDIGSARDKEDANGVAEREKQRNDATNPVASTPAAANAVAASASASGGASAGGSSAVSGAGASSGGSSGGGLGSSGQSSGASSGFDMRGALDKAYMSAGRRKTSRGILSKNANRAGRIIGGIAGATYGMSKGDTEGSGILGNALASATAGSAVGDFVVKPAEAGLNKIEQKHAASQTSKAIASGAMDSELGLDKMMPAGIDGDDVIGKHGETAREIFRKALEEAARVSGTKGMAKGEEVAFKIIADLTDESKLH